MASITVNVEVSRLEHFEGFVSMQIDGDNDPTFWANPEDAWEAIADTVRTRLINSAVEAASRL